MVVGTGIACLAIDARSGRSRRVDGDGYLLGDRRRVVLDRQPGSRGRAGRSRRSRRADEPVRRGGERTRVRLGHRGCASALARSAGQCRCAVRGTSCRSTREPAMRSRPRSWRRPPARSSPRSAAGAAIIDSGRGTGRHHRPYGIRRVSASTRGANDCSAPSRPFSSFRRWVRRSTERAGSRTGRGSGSLRDADHDEEDQMTTTDPLRAVHDDGHRAARIARAIRPTRSIAPRSAIADSIAADGILHVFGTGHSHLMAEELFYRAGGLGGGQSGPHRGSAAARRRRTQHVDGTHRGPRRGDLRPAGRDVRRHAARRSRTPVRTSSRANWSSAGARTRA